MTSTDIPRISHRLPPLSGLLDDTLDQALRARRRRVMIADNPGLNLGALRVPDNTLDRLLQSAALYGADAARQLDARIAESGGAARDAAIFFRIALAVQTRDPALFDLAASHAAQSARAVRDAYWFYPVPVGTFADDSSHIVALFERSAADTGLRLLALELAGKRDVKALRPQIEALLSEPQWTAQAHFALSCMGAATDATRRYVQACLSSQDSARRKIAMELIAVEPRLADDAMLRLALKGQSSDVDNADAADAAWAIGATRDPRQVYQHAAASKDLPDALVLRIVALTGYIDGIIGACAAMAGADGPVTPAQADVLELALGGVPVEARCEPNQRAAKAGALRALLLRVCRHNHIALRNDADLCAWDVQAILAKPEQAATLRLRNGLALAAGAPALGRAVTEVTHALRGWLYIERAALGQHAFALAPLDVARRQELAMMAAQFADDMRVR